MVEDRMGAEETEEVEEEMRAEEPEVVENEMGAEDTDIIEDPVEVRIPPGQVSSCYFVLVVS